MKTIKVLILLLLVVTSSYAQQGVTKIANTREGLLQVGIVQLWENGPWFAEFNVGATNKDEVGGYFCFGNVVDGDLKCKDITINIQGTQYDAATVNWGNQWMMPSGTDFKNLVEKCDTKWETDSTGVVTGLSFVGKGAFSSNSVFFPTSEGTDWDSGTSRIGLYRGANYITGSNPPCSLGLRFEYAYYQTSRKESVYLAAEHLDVWLACPVRAIYAESSNLDSFGNPLRPTKRYVNGNIYIEVDEQVYDLLGRKK